MKEFVGFNFHLLRNESHVSFHEYVMGLIVKIGAGSLGITSLVSTEYAPALAAEVEALDPVLKSDLTGQIADKDRERDDLFRGLVAAIESATHHFDAAKRAAAVTLKGLVEHYGMISSKTYEDERAAIEDLDRELNTPAHKALVTLLGLGDWLAKLVASNKEFVELMEARNEEVSQRPAARMRSARLVTDKALRAILERIEAQITLYGLTSTSSDYKPFVDEYNALAERFKLTLAQEKGRRGKGTMNDEL
jgi:hypothetical protein